jgi:nucleoside-diphosphate-sugar epimerase
MYILITGSSGFVGRALLVAAAKSGYFVRPVFRSEKKIRDYMDINNPAVLISTLSADTRWDDALANIDVVVHCAAMTHVDSLPSSDSLCALRKVNVEGTLNLARQSARSGIKRFIFLSSIKVNGEGNALGRPYSSDDAPSPEDSYGLSKAEAEVGLKHIADETGMEVCIIRPPIIYGPGVKGNFRTLLNLVARGYPLPLGLVTYNRRSFVALHNLVDLILMCVVHPKAANQTFLVSDGYDLSTVELIKSISITMNKPARLISMPLNWLTFSANLFGKKLISQRLLGSLQVNMNKTRETLGWNPPISFNEGLRKIVESDV